MDTIVRAQEETGVCAPRSDPEFFNRELSWLAFNVRVQREADDERTPLLERVKYLGIFTSNLDEFFMKRVGGLKRQVMASVSTLSDDGKTVNQQLAAIRLAVCAMQREQATCFAERIRPALAEHGIHLLRWNELTTPERDWAANYYRKNVFPVLTPFAVDPGHPFPFLSNLSLSLGVVVADPGQDNRLFARVKVPDGIPRWILLPQRDADTYRFLSLVDLIRQNLDSLFPGMQVLSVTPFRVTRNADVETDDEDAEDLVELIEAGLRQRRFASIIRVEHASNPDPWTIEFLRQELQLADADVYELPAELDYVGLDAIVQLDLPRLKFHPWVPVTPPRLADAETDIFTSIRAGDILVHHPYESFSASVERFIASAARDPAVHALKITLYRVGDSPRIMDSLIQAGEAGKQVVCLVELKARFDEQRNIYWAQRLERAGVQVVYGVLGLKTHTKLALVVRQESDGLCCYAHVGTGNYNAQTAALYTDVGLFTCNERITSEAVDLFNYLTGRSLKRDYRTLLVAPMTMRATFMDLIQREIEHQAAGRPARIVAKMNQLADREMTRALYAASQAGVEIDLLVRGFCCLRPGVKGMSERIRVTSVVGRFLEHSRIFYFRDGADRLEDGRLYIGSADWMYRNLSRRVEVVAPIEDPAGRSTLLHILDVMQQDRRNAWDLQPDGTYLQRQPLSSNQRGTHVALMQHAMQHAKPGLGERVLELADSDATS